MFTASAIAVLVAIVFAAFVTEAAVGFGATILTVTLGAHLMPITVLLPSFVPLNMLLSLWIVLRHRHDVALGHLGRRVLPAVGVGMLVGMGLYRFGTPEQLLLAFGLFVVVLSAAELHKALRTLARRDAAHLDDTPDATPDDAPIAPWQSLAMLGSGGLIHGMFGSGGPMIVYVAGRELHDKGRFRATLAALWFLLNGALVAHYLQVGDLNLETARISALLLPALVLGIAAGERAHHRLPQRLFRITVWAVLLAAAAILVGRQVV